MNRQTNRFGLVGKGAFHGLFNPPGTVSREFGSTGWIKTFNGFHEADVALADEIHQRKPDAFIFARDFDDKAQVGFNHQLTSLFVPGFNPVG